MADNGRYIGLDDFPITIWCSAHQQWMWLPSGALVFRCRVPLCFSAMSVKTLAIIINNPPWACSVN